ncbi:kinesin-like protein KIN-14N [Zingiber officinale]|uniref:kinesin-like protein KIN-14N n=1 Tax=Zingiber officinale TaxID=94328 RepID=UPI001C4DB5D3|nr:kinesin-like protein KIN-14N [Zingiber officinale]
MAFIPGSPFDAISRSFIRFQSSPQLHQVNCNEYFAHVQNLKKILVELAPPEVCFSQSETISSQSEEIKLLNKEDSHQVNCNEYFAHVKNLKKILVEVAPPEVCFSQSETISSQSGEIKLLNKEDLHQDDCNEILAHVQSLKKILVEVAPPEVCFSQSETISSQSEEIKLLNKEDSHQVNCNEYFAHVKNLKKLLVEVAPPEVCFSQSETISSQSGEIKLLNKEDLHQDDCNEILAHEQSLAILTEEDLHQDDCNEILAHVQSLAILTTKVAALEETCSSQSGEIKLLRQLLAFSNEKLKRADLTTAEVVKNYEEKKKQVTDLQGHLADAKLQIVELERIRKKLHNTVLELKGNIRVFCRVRPLSYEGSTSESVSSLPFIDPFGHEINLTNNAQSYHFAFDKVFGHEASQGDVFEEISQLIQSALDGYKVCIFAYGQSGSGKTYTMMGNVECPERKGVIPRSFEQIFETIQFLQSQGSKYKMQASMLEIYNDTIRDLLSPDNPTSLEASARVSKQYLIKHDADGNAFVTNLIVIDVCNKEQVSLLLQRASLNRSVGKTLLNEQSSRSHFIFTLKIVGVNERTQHQVEGVLNLIDLARSERLAQSGVIGDRLKETQATNKSLSVLSDVILSIRQKKDHVPFRNSKLTHLLQPYLGGDSKTLMFVNISPEATFFGESLNSLRFANQVHSCELGIPRHQTPTPKFDSRRRHGL